VSPEELARYVRAIVDKAPPLTEHQRARLGSLLRTPRRVKRREAA